MPKELWEGIFSSREWGKYPSETLIRFIARNFYNVSDRKAINILELGLEQVQIYGFVLGRVLL